MIWARHLCVHEIQISIISISIVAYADLHCRQAIEPTSPAQWPKNQNAIEYVFTWVSI